MKQGQIVLAAELRGIGETETGHNKRDWGRVHFGQDMQEVFLAYLLGRSYVGMRVEDAAAWTHFLKDFQATTDKPNELHLVAIGEATIPALHAAALDPDAFRTVTLERCSALGKNWPVPRSPATKPSMSSTEPCNTTIFPI